MQKGRKIQVTLIVTSREKEKKNIPIPAAHGWLEDFFALPPMHSGSIRAPCVVPLIKRGIYLNFRSQTHDFEEK